jgi:streptogramin lyase
MHPRQLVYDAARNGLWFWTSTQNREVVTNAVDFYDIARGTLQTWPIYSGDWSSQLLSGLALAPNGEVWIGWNHNLIDFHPNDGSSVRYALPARIVFSLPQQVIGDLPNDLGVSDIAVGRDGTVWIARYGAVSLTAFSPQSHQFTEHQLPGETGDPAKLALGPDGHVFFTLNLSANHPGYAAEKIGEYAPETGATKVYAQPTLALAVTPQGDLYTALSGVNFGLARASATERANAAAAQRSPVFQRQMAGVQIADTALATDLYGRVWMAIARQPQIAVLDPASGSVRTFTYAAPSIAANPPHTHLGVPTRPAAPDAVWIVPIVAMATDSVGHLWYIRAGYQSIEEISA